jgi:hypothetical protein
MSLMTFVISVKGLLSHQSQESSEVTRMNSTVIFSDLKIKSQTKITASHFLFIFVSSKDSEIEEVAIEFVTVMERVHCVSESSF